MVANKVSISSSSGGVHDPQKECTHAVRVTRSAAPSDITSSSSRPEKETWIYTDLLTNLLVNDDVDQCSRGCYVILAGQYILKDSP